MAVSGLLQYNDREITVRSTSLSYFIRNRIFHGGNLVHLTSNIVKDVVRNPFIPDISRQIDNFFLWIGSFPNDFGDNIFVPEVEACGVIGSSSPAAVHEIIRYAIASGFLIKGSVPGGMRADGTISSISLVITIDGWKKYQK